MALEPLAPGERPAALLDRDRGLRAARASRVLVGALTVHDLSRHGGSLPGRDPDRGRARRAARTGCGARRYWAVLGFEALLAFQIIVTSLALVVASTILAARACAVAIGLGGWLFWKLVRVMGRIQAGECGSRRALARSQHAALR